MRLVDSKSIPPEEFDRIEHQAHMAAADLRSAEFARQVAHYELEWSQAALLRTQPDSIPPEDARLTITSPVTGQVLRVFRESAGYVAVGDELLELGDPTDLEIEVDVLSSDAVKIVPGARVSIERWGGVAPLEARVRRVEPAGFLKVSALGIEEQRVNVIADFTTPLVERRSLGDAFRVEARVVVWEADDVLKVPAGALFRHENDWVTYRVSRGRAERTTVTVGETNGLETEILGGLSEGDVVIVHPSDRVADGTRVAPIP